MNTHTDLEAVTQAREKTPFAFGRLGQHRKPHIGCGGVLHFKMYGIVDGSLNKDRYLKFFISKEVIQLHISSDVKNHISNFICSATQEMYEQVNSKVNITPTLRFFNRRTPWILYSLCHKNVDITTKKNIYHCFLQQYKKPHLKRKIKI